MPRGAFPFTAAAIIAALALVGVTGCGTKPIPTGKKEVVIVKRGERANFGWFYCQIDSVFATDTLGAGNARYTAREGRTYLFCDITIGNQGAGPETAETNLFELIAVDGTDTVGFRQDFEAAIYEGDRAFGESELLKVNEPRRGYIIFNVPKSLSNAWLKLGTAYFFIK